MCHHRSLHPWRTLNARHGSHGTRSEEAKQPRLLKATVGQKSTFYSWNSTNHPVKWASLIKPNLLGHAPRFLTVERDCEGMRIHHHMNHMCPNVRDYRFIACPRPLPCALCLLHSVIMSSCQLFPIMLVHGVPQKDTDYLVKSFLGPLSSNLYGSLPIGSTCIDTGFGCGRVLDNCSHFRCSSVKFPNYFSYKSGADNIFNSWWISVSSSQSRMWGASRRHAAPERHLATGNCESPSTLVFDDLLWCVPILN